MTTQSGHLTVHKLLNNQLKDRIAGGTASTAVTSVCKYIMNANSNENRLFLYLSATAGYCQTSQPCAMVCYVCLFIFVFFLGGGYLDIYILSIMKGL